MPLTRDEVLRIMKDRTGAICPTCLSESLGIKFQQALDAVLDIELRRDYPVRFGTCAECGQDRHHVVWPPRPGFSQPSDDNLRPPR